MTDPDKVADAIVEASKFGGELVKAGRDAGAYLSDVLGGLPKNLVSLFIGDRVAKARMINLARLEKRAQERITQLGTSASIEDVSPKVMIEIAAAAADETREELFELWASLLASAMGASVIARTSFVEALKQMDPPDASTFRALTMPSNPRRQDSAVGTVVGPDRIADLLERTNLDRLEVMTSLARLGSMGIVSLDQGTYNPRLTDFGQSLARAVLR
jgi:hypothetical protein